MGVNSMTKRKWQQLAEEHDRAVCEGIEPFIMSASSSSCLASLCSNQSDEGMTGAPLLFDYLSVNVCFTQIPRLKLPLSKSALLRVNLKQKCDRNVGGVSAR